MTEAPQNTVLPTQEGVLTEVFHFLKTNGGTVFKILMRRAFPLFVLVTAFHISLIFVSVPFANPWLFLVADFVLWLGVARLTSGVIGAVIVSQSKRDVPVRYAEAVAIGKSLFRSTKASYIVSALILTAAFWITDIIGIAVFIFALNIQIVSAVRKLPFKEAFAATQAYFSKGDFKKYLGGIIAVSIVQAIVLGIIAAILTFFTFMFELIPYGSGFEINTLIFNVLRLAVAAALILNFSIAYIKANPQIAMSEVVSFYLKGRTATGDHYSYADSSHSKLAEHTSVSDRPTHIKKEVHRKGNDARANEERSKKSEKGTDRFDFENQTNRFSTDKDRKF